MKQSTKYYITSLCSMAIGGFSLGTIMNDSDSFMYVFMNVFFYIFAGGMLEKSRTMKKTENFKPQGGNNND